MLSAWKMVVQRTIAAKNTLMSERSAILLPTHEFYPKRGGIGIYIEELARAAIASYAVEVWAPQAEALHSIGFSFALRQLPIKGNQNLPNVIKTALRLHMTLQREPERILCLAEPGALRAVMLAMGFNMRFKNPCVLVLHGSEVLGFHARPDLHHRFQKLLNRADRIGVVSTHVEKLLCRHFKVSNNRIRLTPGALRSEYRISDTASKPRDDNTVTLLCVARIHPRKGQHALLEALAMLPEKMQRQVSLRIIGPAVNEKYFQEIEAMASRTHARVRIEGELDDTSLQEAYTQADIFAMTSMPYRNSVEGYGLVYLEAAAHGLPCLAHDLGGVSEAVIHEKTGLLASPADRSELARALQRIIKERELRNRMSLAAREHAMARSWDQVVDTLFSKLPANSSR